MTTSETSRYVRVTVELVLEVEDPERLGAAALARIDGDASVPDDERAQARAAVRGDEAEALAYLVEPHDLIKDVPGIGLAQASWTSELIDYDPDAVEWDLYEIGEDGEDPDDEVSEEVGGVIDGAVGGGEVTAGRR
ncbi:hypothetical protein ACIQVO_23805 [Streptomyces sp. NPDC101062]|uniref:hypothetical protein n=1 Tax=unclassified Streptomyces TaxID=2593676 RepID=UPI002E795434|nr:hypothetical protein [Streptomyces sp. JV176]MEE1804138.1 hypothetical protein [Streptomyces sp. JV176]